VTRLRYLLSVFICLSACNLQAETGSGAGQRIISLSPHLAELVFAVGAGDHLIGVSAYTDYPEAASRLPVVGDAFMLDLERLTLLKPDMLLAWQGGTPAHVIDELKSRGYRVEEITTRNLDDVPLALRRIGRLTGRIEKANAAADKFDAGLTSLRERASGSSPIAVFYQVSSRPLYTINGEHYVSQLIEVCGGSNVFADLGRLAPLIGVEAVIERNPEVMLAADDAGPDAFIEWDRWPGIAANRYGNRFLMPAAEIGRATPRLLEAGAAICEALENGRKSRETYRG
jgi:iron complex transport system substrate-binding protein